MSDMKVLLLGWDLMPSLQDEQDQKNGCYAVAKALGGQVDLSMILPVADPDFILQNVTLTGLNNIDLPAIEPSGPKKEIQPFAEGQHIRQDIPLYGAPIHPASREVSAWVEQAGQAASAGVLQINQGTRNVSEVMGTQNIFDQGILNQVTLDSQIIQYARWATRLAAHRHFDVIYAYDWRTYLAGSELKLVCEKPLVLQVQSLTQSRNNPDSQGWMYQVELQALQKADCIIAATDDLAATIAEKYHISPAIIKSLEGHRNGNATEKRPAATDEIPGGFGENSLGNGVKDSISEVLAIKANKNESPEKDLEGSLEAKSEKHLSEILDESRQKAAEKIRDILLQVAA
jgi:hypothetical protein